MFKKAALFTEIIVTALLLLMPSAAVFAQSNNGAVTSPDITNGLCAGANLQVGTNCSSGGISDAQAQDKINRIIKTIVNLFSLVVGVVSVIMIIIGGLRYITSGGDSTNVTGAKNTILYAIIGLIIVALSQFIVRFILTKVAQA